MLAGQRNVNTARTIFLPEQFNAALTFLDRNVAEGRGNKTAIYHEGISYTYAQLTATLWQAIQHIRPQLKYLRHVVIVNDTGTPFTSKAETTIHDFDTWVNRATGKVQRFLLRETGKTEPLPPSMQNEIL